MSLTRLSPLVRLRDVSDTSDVLLLCTWMGASPKLVSKYYDEYVRLFPRHSIVLVTVTMSEMFLTSDAATTQALLPAVQLIQSKLAGKGSLVGAIYSNGGAHSLTRIAEIWKSRTQTPLPLEGLIIDSAPGDPQDLASGHRAVILSFPAPLRPVFSLLLWVVFYIWKLLIVLGLSVNPIGRLRNALIDDTLFPPYRGSGEKAEANKRAYIYSKEDVIVPYLTVQAAAADSRRLGWDVREERFNGSAHVGHAIKEKERYWGIVRDVLSDDR